MTGDLRPPCHPDARFYVTTRSTGFFGSSEDVPDEICCGAPLCTNTWSPAGVAGEFNRMPDPAPEAGPA